jgi:hypothetical protein
MNTKIKRRQQFRQPWVQLARNEYRDKIRTDQQRKLYPIRRIDKPRKRDLISSGDITKGGVQKVIHTALYTTFSPMKTGTSKTAQFNL